MFHPSYFTTAVWKRLAVQPSRSSVIPTSSRIDTDSFQYEAILSKVERFGLGEKISADEEERQEEIHKERRHVARDFRQGRIEAGLEYGLRETNPP